MAGALDTRAYAQGYYSMDDLYPNSGHWSTRDLSVPEGAELSLYNEPKQETDTNKAEVVQAQKTAGNSGMTNKQENKTAIFLGIGGLVALLFLMSR